MAIRAILTEGSDYAVFDDILVRVTAAGLYRIMEIHASGAEAVIQIKGFTVEFEAAAGGISV
jgi:hypothetical protein